MDAYTRSKMELLGLSLEPMVGANAESRYRAAFLEGRVQGFTPLLIQPSGTLAESIELCLEDLGLPESTQGAADARAQILARAGDVDVEAFFNERLEEYLAYLGDEGAFIPSDPNDALHFTGDELYMVKIPTLKPYEAPAFMPMGGFNDCPDPATQVAVFRHWYERYGAVPAVVTYDTWQLTVDRPPLSEADCCQLAREHYAFSSDNILQSGGPLTTLKGYAGAHRGSHCWFFWWD